MNLFYFNENSCLNNGVVRTINFVLLALFILSNLSSPLFKTFISLSRIEILLIVFLTGILSQYASDKIISGTDFHEWDYNERKKKKSFTIKCIFISSIISNLIMFSIIFAYHAYNKYNDITQPYNIICIITILYFLFNYLNIGVLYYPLFADELEQSFDTEDKPKDWQDN